MGKQKQLMKSYLWPLFTQHWYTDAGFGQVGWINCTRSHCTYLIKSVDHLIYLTHFKIVLLKYLYYSIPLSIHSLSTVFCDNKNMVAQFHNEIIFFHAGAPLWGYILLMNFKTWEKPWYVSKPWKHLKQQMLILTKSHLSLLRSPETSNAPFQFSHWVLRCYIPIIGNMPFFFL